MDSLDEKTLNPLLTNLKVPTETHINLELSTNEILHEQRKEAHELQSWEELLTYVRFKY